LGPRRSDQEIPETTSRLHVSRARERVVRYRSLPVGWAALLILGLAIAAAVLLTVTGRLWWGAAAFGAGVALTGIMLGLATWDLFVDLLAQRDAPNLALPRRIALGLPRQVVPFLSPAAFAIGILIGHQYWS
jgi:hypothetical protein